jgi:hypothetical protein
VNEKIEAVLQKYERLLGDIWAVSMRYLGFFAVKLLVERVIWDVSKEYPEIGFLVFDESGISFKRVREKLGEAENLPLEKMFDRFITRYIEILAKLIGKDKVEEIEKELSELSKEGE